MTRAELLAEINAYASELGVPPVSDRRLSDWRDQDLVPPPASKGAGRGRGVLRDWGEEALEAARHILRLQSMGELRASQHLAYLWLTGGSQSIVQAQEAISKEFERMVRRLRRAVPAAVAPETPFAQGALRRRIGPLDPDLVPLAGTGPDGRPVTESLAVRGLPAMVGDFGKSAANEWEAVFPVLRDVRGFELIQELLAGYDGYVGLGDETDQSALSALATASPGEFELARSHFQATWAVIGIAIGWLSEPETPLARKLLSIDRAEWAIGLFVQHLNGIQKSEKSREIRR